MNKAIYILTLFVSVSFGQNMATIRVREQSIPGLTQGLDALDSSMNSITGRYATAGYVYSYGSNYISSYVLGFLPGLIGAYTYPFRTNELSFSRGTTMRLSGVRTAHLTTDLADVASLTSTGTVTAATSFLQGTYGLDNLTAADLTLSSGVDMEDVVADSIHSPLATLRSTNVTAETLSPHIENIMVTAEDLILTGDMYIQGRKSSGDKYKFPILQLGSDTGAVWYNPQYALPFSTNGAYLTGTRATEFRVTPEAPATGFHTVAVEDTVPLPLFGTGPRAGAAHGPRGSVRVMIPTNAGPYTLSAYLLPAVDASLAFKLYRPSRWDPEERPPFPPLPPLIEPDPPPPLPPSPPSTSPGTDYYSSVATSDTKTMRFYGADDRGWVAGSVAGFIVTGDEGEVATAMAQARAWIGDPPIDSSIPKPPTKEVEYTGVLVGAPKDHLQDISTSLAGGIHTTAVYKREAYTMRKGSVYFGIYKHEQSIVVRSYRNGGVTWGVMLGSVGSVAWNGYYGRGIIEVGPVTVKNLSPWEVPNSYD